MKRTAIITALQIFLYFSAINAIAYYGQKNVAEIQDDGRSCSERFSEIKSRVQKVIDEYNQKDREAYR